MPQPKAVEEEIKELMDFFNDADVPPLRDAPSRLGPPTRLGPPARPLGSFCPSPQACPTDYPRLKKARGEAE